MQYKVHITFSNGLTMVEDHQDDTIGSALDRLTKGPAARGGMIKEVKCVDQWDMTNFLVQDGKLVFPTKEDLKDD